MRLAGRDHPPEDSFYAWGPNVPADFVHNYEASRLADAAGPALDFPRRRKDSPMSKPKVIITCAVTGSIHTPSMSPHLPVTAEEIAEAAIGAAEAGAAIVHLHARDPADGRPDQIAGAFAPFLEVIKQRSELRGQHHDRRRLDDDDRGAAKPVAQFKPEVASLNMGSMNFGLYPMLGRFKEFKHDWERPYLEGSRDRIFKNTFADIEKNPNDLRRQRHAVRDRMLRHRPSLHARPFRRSRSRQAAVLRAERVRHSRRHRRRTPRT